MRSGIICDRLHGMKEKAAEYLLRDRLKNIDALEQLKDPRTRVLYAGNDGVFLQYDFLFQLSAEPGTKEHFLPLLLSALPDKGEYLVVLHTPELSDALQTHRKLSLIMDCCNCVYDAAEPIPFTLPQGVEIRPLDQSHFPFVRAHYHSVDDADYVRERIGAGMLGAFVNGEAAGFIGTHDELSIGLLEILPAFRRRGLAFALEASMVNTLLAAGRLPFCQVRLGNDASFALQRKLGFTVSDHPVRWMEQTK